MGSYQNKSKVSIMSAHQLPQPAHQHRAAGFSPAAHGGALRPEAAKEINARVDCAELAERLGLEQPKGQKNFKSWSDGDHSPALACYPADSKGGSRWKNHRTGEHGGPLDMLMGVRGLSFPEAVRELGRMFGIAVERPREAASLEPRREQSLAEFIAGQVWKDARGPRKAELVDYLTGRGIAQAVVERAIKVGALGLNLWVSQTVAEGEVSHGGPGAAFVVRERVGGQVVAVDTRYFDAEANGGVKTNSQGEKVGYPWTSDWKRVAAARRVYIVESSINALSIESCDIPGTAAVALRGTGNVDTIDWSFLRGKEVVACLDNDEPLSTGPKAGYCAGLMAAWRLHEVLTALDVSCLLVDQGDWYEDPEALKGPINDVNDYLLLCGRDDTAKALQRLEPWAVPGLPGNDRKLGRPRLFLPSHDYQTYWKYRVTADFTKVIGRTTKDDDGNEKHDFNDVCGFRVAAVSRVRIASPIATMTGDEDHSPHTVFALSVQVARHGALLQRRVVDDERLHNIEVWKKLGPIYAPTAFARLVNIWERASAIGARDAVNFVGLAWRDGKAVVNEGPDCFFQDPRQQCPYSELLFPSGSRSDALAVLKAFSETFAEGAALVPLVWALGAHLKAFLGFWPHFVMQAEKATGKTTLVKRLERAVAMSTSSRQSLQTEFRQMTSLSYTSHPVGWGEMSTNKQDVINKAVHNLQEAYQFEHTRRGSDLMDFLLCAPVLLSGEDVPVDSLVGKIVRSELTKAKRGPLIDEALPAFPVKEWLQWLAKQGKDRVRQLHAEQVQDLFDNCLATTNDTGAERMVHNYAAVGVAWRLLCEFVERPPESAGFLRHLTAEMNRHIGETATDRQPWAWIVEKLLSEIAAHRFMHPFKFDREDDVEVLCVRTGHVMDHMRQTNYLREFWDGLPVKSDRVFKRQLEQADVLLKGPGGAALPVERTVKGQRVGHMVALALPALRQYGLHAVVPVEGREGGEG